MPRDLEDQAQNVASENQSEPSADPAKPNEYYSKSSIRPNANMLSGGRCLNLVFELKDLTTNERFILCYLGAQQDYRGDFQSKKPHSQSTIAEKLGLSKMTVIRCLKSLKERGYISLQERIGIKGQTLCQSIQITEKPFEDYRDILVEKYNKEYSQKEIEDKSTHVDNDSGVNKGGSHSVTPGVTQSYPKLIPSNSIPNLNKRRVKPDLSQSDPVKIKAAVKKTAGPICKDEVLLEISDNLMRRAKSLVPKIKADRNKWALELAKICKEFSWSSDQLEDFLTWIINHKFWSNNFYSPMTLRKRRTGEELRKIDNLVSQYQKEKRPLRIAPSEPMGRSPFQMLPGL